MAIFDIRDYGAVGNGSIDSTNAIQKAIDACCADGGGTVLVSGGNYLTYTLMLKDGVRFEIDANAVLTGGTVPELYPEIPDNTFWQPAHASRSNRRTLIYAEGANNIAITGRGTIDGQGKTFMVQDDRQYNLLQHWQRKHDSLIPGRCILFVGCRNILMEDITIFNSAGWSTWFLDCDRIQIHRIKIDCDFRIPNVDGIHISASRDVTVSDCIIRSSDDAIVLRSHQEQLFRPRPCERVVVSNCTIKTGSSAVRIGWSNDYEIRDCTFTNLSIEHSFAGFSILIPEITQKQFDPPRYPGMPWTPPEVQPFYVENILFNNIKMEVETCFMNINLADNMPIRGINNLSFQNIYAVCGSYPFIKARPEYQVSRIAFDNISLEIREPERRDLFNYRCFHDKMEFDHVKDLELNRFKIVRGITPDGGRSAKA